jgi:hypothetical protein
VDLDMRREHEDADLREFCANRLGGVQTLGRMGGGHANVKHDELWTVPANQPHELGRIGRQTDDLKARRLEQAGDALAQEEVVVCDHHTEVSHGGVILPPAYSGSGTSDGGRALGAPRRSVPLAYTVRARRRGTPWARVVGWALAPERQRA